MYLRVHSLILRRQNLSLECVYPWFLHSGLVRLPHSLNASSAHPPSIIFRTFLRVITFFNSYSEPTVFENYVHDLYVDDQLVELSLWDTAGASCPLPAALRLTSAAPARTGGV